MHLEILKNLNLVHFFFVQDFLTVEELLASECKNCGSSPDMRLTSQDSFNSCFEFQLTCNNTALRTPTDAKICITTLDSNGKIIWKDERSFPVCVSNKNIFQTKIKTVILI